MPHSASLRPEDGGNDAGFAADMTAALPPTCRRHVRGHAAVMSAAEYRRRVSLSIIFN